LKPHLQMLRNLKDILVLRAICEVKLARTDDALRDIQLCLRLAESLRHEPGIGSQLVRVVIARACLQPIWEGLATECWSDEHLAAIQAALRSVNPLADCERTMQYQRADFNRLLDELERGDISAHSYLMHSIAVVGIPRVFAASKGATVLPRLPSPCLAHTGPTGVRPHLPRQNLSTRERPRPRVYVHQTNALQQELWRRTQGYAPREFIVALPSRCGLAGIGNSFAKRQVALDEAQIACALERYRLEHGDYPTKLGELSPQFIDNLPPDVIDGQPLRYHRTADGQYRLYSIGWDESDQGGVLAPSSPAGVTPATGCGGTLPRSRSRRASHRRCRRKGRAW